MIVKIKRQSLSIQDWKRAVPRLENHYGDISPTDRDDTSFSFHLLAFCIDTGFFYVASQLFKTRVNCYIRQNLKKL